MQAQMRLGPRSGSSERDQESDLAINQTQLRLGTDSLQGHSAISVDSPQAHLDIHGQVVHVTQIINAGSGTVSGCRLSGTSE